MRKKAAQRILEAIEARTRGAKIFSSGFSNWVSLKSRPTQFSSSKNFPAGLEKYQREERQDAGVKAVYSAGETSEPAPTA